MTTLLAHDRPILVTGAGGAIGGTGRSVTTSLLAKGYKVRALVRKEDERADELRRPGAEVVIGDLTPISAVDVANAVSMILENPAPHIGKIYNLTGLESADLEHAARVFPEALGRPIRYRNVPVAP